MNSITLKDVVFEDMIQYKEPSMYLITSKCDFKCCVEQGLDISVCQNQPIVDMPNRDISFNLILSAYQSNDIMKAVVLGGLEPMLQFEEVYNLIAYFREHNDKSTFVIYTGYNKEEIIDKVEKLKNLKNIIIKFGRFVPNQKSHKDDILGIDLCSDNQYAEKIC